MRRPNRNSMPARQLETGEGDRRLNSWDIFATTRRLPYIQ